MFLRRKRRIPTRLEILLVALIFSFLLLLVAYASFATRKANKDNFVRNPKVEGVIKNVREEIDEDDGLVEQKTNRYEYVDIAYNVNGIDYMKEFYYDGADSSMIGQKIQVAYKADDPNDSYIDNMGAADIISVITEKSFLKMSGLSILAVGIIICTRFFRRRYNGA